MTWFTFEGDRLSFTEENALVRVGVDGRKQKAVYSQEEVLEAGLGGGDSKDGEDG